ncbi:hypothetical protein ACQP2X_22860 [Actinoplanes sp. CA-131856]
MSRSWGSRLLDLGDAGHIITDSGYGEGPPATTPAGPEADREHVRGRRLKKVVINGHGGARLRT